MTQSEFRIKGALTTGDGRNAPAMNDGLAYTGRLEWLPFGVFTKDGDFMEGDLYREPVPKLALGFTASFNHKAQKSGGQTGPDFPEPRDITTVIADFVFKYNGFSLAAEWIQKSSDNPFYDPGSDPFPLLHMLVGRGYNSQVSYINRRDLEFALRYALVDPERSLDNYEARREEILLGVTRYLRGHRVKLQSHLGYYRYSGDSPLLSLPNDHFTLMFQLEFGI